MAKRFINTDLFREDFYLDLDTPCKLYYLYALLNADHAGVLKPNLRAFNALNGLELDVDTFLTQINATAQKVEKLEGGLLYLTDFVAFQYGEVLNPANRVHKSVLDILKKNNLSSLIAPSMGLNNPSIGVKDKDKDKDKDKEIVTFIKKDSPLENLPAPTDTPTEAEVQNAFRAAMESIGLDSSAMGGYLVLGSSFFTHYEAQGWLRGNGMAVSKWRSLVTQWLAKEKGRQAGKGYSTQVPNTVRTWG